MATRLGSLKWRINVPASVENPEPSTRKVVKVASLVARAVLAVSEKSETRRKYGDR